MRFPVFSGDHCSPQFYCRGPSAGHRCGCAPRMSTSRPCSPWPAGSATASFVPFIMMGPSHRSGERSQRPAAGSSSRLPPFGVGGCPMSEPVSDAISIAEGLLGELFGQPCRPSTEAETRSQTAGKQHPSRCSSQEMGCSKTSASTYSSNTSDTTRGCRPRTEDTTRGCRPRTEDTTRGCRPRTEDTTRGCRPRTEDTTRGSRPRTEDTTRGCRPRTEDTTRGCRPRTEDTTRGCRPRTEDTTRGCRPKTEDPVQKPSRIGSSRTGSEGSSNTVQKTEDQSAAAEKIMSSCPPRKTESGDSVWRHSFFFPGVSPNKISVKVNNGKALVHASHDNMCGPSTYLSKLKITRSVALPENIDRKTLTCSMKQDGLLVLQARFKDITAVSTAEEKETLAEHAENADTSEREMVSTDPTENKPVRKETLPDCLNKTAVSANNEREILSLESNERVLEALEDKSEKLCALGDKAGDLQGSENKTEEVDTAADCAESLQEKSEDAADDQDSTRAQNTAGQETACHTDEVSDQNEEKLSTLCHLSNDGAQETDTEELKSQQSILRAGEKGDMNNQTTTDSNHTASFPIIEEPEDESSSIDEDFPQKKRITRESSTEDFVVIDEEPVSSGDINSEDGHQDGNDAEDAQEREGKVVLKEHQAGTDAEDAQVKEGRVVSKGQIQAAETAEEQPDTDTSTSADTNPARPTKRTDDQQHAAQASEENCSMLSEESGTLHDEDHGAMATDGTGAFHAALPLVGFRPEDVHVSLQGRTLHITANRQVWLGDAPCAESVERRLELPAHVDVFTVHCVYNQDEGCLVISADPQSQQRRVPVVLQ